MTKKTLTKTSWENGGESIAVSNIPTSVKRKGLRVVARYGGATATYRATSTRAARRLADRLRRGYCEKVDFEANVHIPSSEEE